MSIPVLYPELATSKVPHSKILRGCATFRLSGGVPRVKFWEKITVNPVTTITTFAFRKITCAFGGNLEVLENEPF